jgi:hypothetical protein
LRARDIPDDPAKPFGPKEALLGTLAGGTGVPLNWDDPIT